MRVFGVSHIGNSRANNEDNFLIRKKIMDLDTIKRFSAQFPSVCQTCRGKSDNTLLAVSDGMGGHSSGEMASYLTVKRLYENCSEIVGNGGEDICRIISEINRAVFDESQNNPEYKGMGATLCGFVCGNDKIIGFNVGDSRLYRFEKGNLQQLSKDHSEGQRLFDLKLLNEEELKSFPKRKAIYKHIGMRTDLVADVFEIAPCSKGTVFLLCSDGLTDAISDPEICEILDRRASLKEKGKKLLNTALERNVGHGDNITIILTEF